MSDDNLTRLSEDVEENVSFYIERYCEAKNAWEEVDGFLVHRTDPKKSYNERYDAFIRDREASKAFWQWVYDNYTI